MAQIDREKLKKIMGIVLNVLLYTFMALCLAALLVSVLSKKQNDAVTLFGKYQLLVVTSESMAKNPDKDLSGYKIKSIPLGSIVFVRLKPEKQEDLKAFYDDFKVGDVITFKYDFTNREGDYSKYGKTKQPTITHRLTKIEPTEHGYWLTFNGDNVGENEIPQRFEVRYDDPDFDGVAMDFVIGKVVGQAKFLGYIVTALHNPVGLALIVIVPCAIIAVAEAVRIGSVIAARKRETVEAENQRIATESQEKAQEIEELKKRLSMLEKNNSSEENDPPDEQDPSTDPSEQEAATAEDPSPAEDKPEPESDPAERSAEEQPDGTDGK